MLVLHSGLRAHCRSAIILSVALCALSCDSGPMNRPTAVSPAPLPAPSPTPGSVSYRVAGAVLDERGVPVAGADLTIEGSSPSKTVVTGANGAYDITVDLLQRGTTLTVRKTGYEASRYWVSLDPAQTTSRNLKLHDLQNVTAGQSLHLALDLDDPGCGFELYTCRRVRIRSSSRGTLTIVVTPDNGAAQLGLVTAGQEPGLGTLDRLSVPVVAGSETVIEIVIFSGRFPEGFTLNTSIESR